MTTVQVLSPLEKETGPPGSLHKKCCAIGSGFLSCNANPLNVQHPSRSITSPVWDTVRGGGTCANMLMLIMLAIPLITKSFVSDLGVLCHLPASTELYQADLLACKYGEILYSSVFNSLTSSCLLFSLLSYALAVMNYFLSLCLKRCSSLYLKFYYLCFQPASASQCTISPRKPSRLVAWFWILCLFSHNALCTNLQSSWHIILCVAYFTHVASPLDRKLLKGHFLFVFVGPVSKDFVSCHTWHVNVQ